MHSPNDKVGELFISGFTGDSPSDRIFQQIESESLGGIVLFAENCVDHNRLHIIIEELQARAERPLFIAIDQEGGRVCRLKGQPAEYLSAENYGRNTEHGAESLELALERYRADLGKAVSYMSDLGINLLLGPVCDLQPQLSNAGESTALNERTFSDSPHIISAFVRATVEITREYNLLCCLKHAPGLGSVSVDPHFKLGASALNLDQFRDSDLIPFREGCSAGANMIMTSHFLIPECDNLPVTFSKKITQSLIRDEMPKDLALITDDMDMGALNDFSETNNKFIAALNSEHDILLARSSDTTINGILAVRQGLENGEIPQQRFSQALARIDKLRNILERVA